jgi:hypothetical protein
MIWLMILHLLIQRWLSAKILKSQQDHQENKMTFTNQQVLSEPEPVPPKPHFPMVTTNEQYLAAVTNWRSSGVTFGVRP